MIRKLSLGFISLFIGHSFFAHLALAETVDETAPIVSITSPDNNSKAKGMVTVKAEASDENGVTKTELYVDGVLMDTDTSSPYSFTWDTINVSKGRHELTVKAYDEAGNVGTSEIARVKVRKLLKIKQNVTVTKFDYALNFEFQRDLLQAHAYRKLSNEYGARAT